MNNLLQKIRAFLPGFKKDITEKKQAVQPWRDWLISILLFTMIMVVGGVISARLFVKYSNLDLSYSDSKVELPKYSGDLINQAIEKYRGKSTQYQQVDVSKVIPVVTETAADIPGDSDSGENTETETATSTSNEATDEVASTTDDSNPDTDTEIKNDSADEPEAIAQPVF